MITVPALALLACAGPSKSDSLSDPNRAHGEPDPAPAGVRSSEVEPATGPHGSEDEHAPLGDADDYDHDEPTTSPEPADDAEWEEEDTDSGWVGDFIGDDGAVLPSTDRG